MADLAAGTAEPEARRAYTCGILGFNLPTAGRPRGRQARYLAQHFPAVSRSGCSAATITRARHRRQTSPMGSGLRCS